MWKSFLLVVFCSASFCHSQSNLSIGIEAGPSITRLRGDNPPDSKSSYHFYGSAILEYGLSANFSFKSGIALESKGNKVEYAYETNPDDPFAIENVEYKNKIRYLTIPLLIKYNTRGTFQFIFSAGPHLNFLINSDEQKVKNFDFGITSGLGCQLKINNSRYSIEFRNSLGLTNINNSKLLSENALKANAYYVLIGYSHTL